MKPLHECLNYAYGLLRKWGGRPFLAVTCAGKLPSLFAPQTVYVLLEDNEPWQASMLCPCGCGAILDMNLLPDDRPVWSIDVDTNRVVSMVPSIWRQTGCHSHFFLRRGRIVWAR
jgi:Family of unknown function (DUF6527)